FVLAAALRLFRLDAQSVWFDEALTITDARLPASQILGSTAKDFANPPLHNYLLHGWFQVLGADPFQARLFSAVCGILSVLIVFAIVARFFGRSVAVMAAALMATSQLAVLYSQEARPYALLLLFVLVVALLAVRAVDRRSLIAWLGFAVMSSLTML